MAGGAHRCVEPATADGSGDALEREDLDGDPRRVVREGRLGRPRDAGRRDQRLVALDDLGAGYSGLSSLTLLEPEVVKLDRSLTHDVHRSASRQAVERSVVELCRSLDIQVIGEGIEREAEAEMLRSLDVGQLQGFLIAFPARVRGPTHSHLL